MLTLVAAIRVPARAAAIGWLNAFLATSQDQGRPTLHRTLSVEIFDAGVHLISCDGQALFRTWVPTDPDKPAWPTIDECPNVAVIVRDRDLFGLAFMKTLLKVTSEDAHAHEELTIETVVADEDPATPTLGDELAQEILILRACGQRLDLQLLEAKYPEWRQLQFGIDSVERVDELIVAPRMFAMLGKLKNIDTLDLEVRGDDKAIWFTARCVSEVRARGLIMPMLKPADRSGK